MTARARALVILASLAVLTATAACGSALSDEEVLRANGVDLAAREATATDGAPSAASGGVGPAATSTTLPGADAGPIRGGPGTTAPGSGPKATGTIGTPGETGPIVIGSVGNYSGPAGAGQAGLPRAVQVWAASVNARGGLFGRPVKVIVQDDGGDPARYAAAVQDLVENRGVIAFVGQGAVLSLRGGMRYLSDKGIPVIGNDCAAPEW
jgi:ABC-type branched-subunit amino acid transport system substrate-binding protein